MAESDLTDPTDPTARPDLVEEAIGKASVADRSQFWFGFVGITLSAISAAIAAIAVITSVRVGEEQARWARESVEATRNSFQLTQRPFVIASRLELSKYEGIKGKWGQLWKVTPSLQNIGDTPATDLDVDIHMVPYADVDTGSPDDDPAVAYGPKDPDIYRGTIELGPFPNLQSHFVLAARQEIPLTGLSLVPERSYRSMLGWDASDDGTIGYYVLGSIRYRDVFEPPGAHVSKFCFQVSGFPSHGHFEPSTSSCPQWNCIDRECERDRDRFEARVREVYHQVRRPIPKDYFVRIDELKPWVRDRRGEVIFGVLENSK